MQLKECRACDSQELKSFLNLGKLPISNDYLISPNQKSEKYDLNLFVCESCSFLQLSEVHDPKVHFNENYPYFSAYSSTWVKHCRDSASYLVDFLELDLNDYVYEIASNDGTFMSEFHQLGMKVLGIEPTANTAERATAKGLETIVDFFSFELSLEIAQKYQPPALIIGCNVLAHVPNIKNFISGLRRLMSTESVACFEFPHATRMISENQFDTIYHEHYSYLNVTPLIPLFGEMGLILFRVEELSTHGGSLRIFLAPEESLRFVEESVEKIVFFESKYSPLDDKVKEKFSGAVEQIARELKEQITFMVENGRKIAIYGAAAKGTTMLNYAQIDSSMIPFAVDSSEFKQGRYIPGTGIKIISPEALSTSEFDCFLVLAWNFADEIVSNLSVMLRRPFSVLIPIPEVSLRSIPR